MRFGSAAFLVIELLTGCNLAFGQAPAQRAWDILEKGHDSHSTKERLNAVRALGVLPGNSHALTLAEQAISDKKPDVRAAAALTLGRLGSFHSIPLLKEPSRPRVDRKSTRLNSSHGYISYAVFCLKKKNTPKPATPLSFASPVNLGLSRHQPVILGDQLPPHRHDVGFVTREDRVVLLLGIVSPWLA